MMAEIYLTVDQKFVAPPVKERSKKIMTTLKIGPKIYAPPIFSSPTTDKF